jgi:serine/threonine protein kinase/Tol biopolymer transport system component
MGLAAGTRLGPYEIQSPLGAGGMGEVYRARDTRLDRTVAIKLLSTDLTTNADLRARFEREARTIATLDHPHICVVYDVGEHQGQHFLVMQHLEGETLAARLAKSPSGLPLAQVLKIGMEIADALDKTHCAGITHRDLKPANIMLTKSGAKLLDFGLAKLRPTAPISMSGMTRLATATPGTASGTILGTVHYMAPEQVEGREADARSDIWALGAVLYEMISGRRPFDGVSPASVIGSILKDEPPRLSARQPLAPPALDHVVDGCLTKDPDRRWQSAADIRLQLEWIANAPSSVASASRGTRRRGTLALQAIVGTVALVAAVAMTRTCSTVGTDPVVMTVARVTHEAGVSEWPTWSPDGSLFAFASNREGSFELYVGSPASGQEVVNITNHAADDVQPAFSPDGKTIAFVSTRAAKTGLIKVGTFIGFDTRTYGGDIWITSTLGGQARRLAQDGNFPVWHPGGDRVIYVSGREDQRAIMAVSVDGGLPSEILPSANSRWEIIRLGVSPDGRWITFEDQNRELLAMPAAGGVPLRLVEGSSHVWDRAGERIFYVNQQSTGGTRIEVAEIGSGAAMPAVTRVRVAGVSTGTLRDLAIGPDGGQLLATGTDESLNVARIRLTPDGGGVIGAEEPLSTGHVRDRFPAVSPDGERIVAGSNRIGDEGLWMLAVSTGRWTRVQLPEDPAAWVTEACWSPNGRDLGVKRFFRNRTAALWRVAVDGSAAEPLTTAAPTIGGTFPCAFSADGQRLVHSRVVDGFSQLFLLDLDTRREQRLTQSPSHKYQAAWSRDGHWVAFSANTDGTVQVWRIPAAGGAEAQLTSGAERKLHFFYSPDGHWLYVQPSHRNIYRMPAEGGALQPVTRFPESGLFIEEPTIAPDGRYLAYNRGRAGGGSSLWLLTMGEGRGPAE